MSLRKRALTIIQQGIQHGGTTHTLIRYCISGGISAALNYLLFIGSIAAGIHYVIAATIASITTALFGYNIHRTLTFRVKRAASIRELTSFLFVFGVQYVIGITGYVLLIGYLRLNASLAFVLDNSFLVVTAFLLLRGVTFNESVDKR
jgi:putative flippase GtrA